jgi:hypothetical protein
MRPLVPSPGDMVGDLLSFSLYFSVTSNADWERFGVGLGTERDAGKPALQERH